MTFHKTAFDCLFLWRLYSWHVIGYVIPLVNQFTMYFDSLRLGRCIVQFSSGCYYYYSSPLNLCTITFCLLFFVHLIHIELKWYVVYSAIDRYTVWLNAHLTEWVMYIKRMNDAHKIVLSDFSYTNPDNFDNWIVIAALMPPSLDSIHRDNIHIFLSFKISLFFVIESIFDEESRVMRYLELIWRKNDNQMSFDSLALITKKSLL